MALLGLQGIGFAYDGRPVLREVALGVDAGEVVAVVGPNGAGKTTLLRIASGYLAPSAGRVLLDGEDLAAVPRAGAARRIAGVAGEEASPFPFLVRATVELGRHPWRGRFGEPAPEDERAVDEALLALDLVSLASRPLPALSSGERQRAAIARCLAQEADVVLLDEPTAHLDLGHALRVLHLFRHRARARGLAVLAALHDLNLAAAFADRVVLLVEGRVVADGPPGRVLTAEAVAAAFGAPVHVLTHPDAGTPVVVGAAPTAGSPS